MITVFILFLIASIVFVKHYKKTSIYPLLSIIISFLIFSLFILEVEFSHIEYFASDEITYFATDLNLLQNYNRLFWYGINYFLSNFDLYGKLSLKIINIPFLFFSLYLLWKIFNFNNQIFFIVIILPYIPLIATKNLRDILILFLIISTFYLYEKENKWRIVLPIVTLFFLRPFIGIILFSLVIFDHYLKPIMKTSVKISLLKPAIYINLYILKYIAYTILVVYIFFSIPFIKNRINSYWLYFSYYTSEKGISEKQENRRAIQTGNYIKDYTIGGLRYAFTPLPTSLLYRMLSEEKTVWGKVDDVTRIINQTSYYFLILLVVLNYRSIYNNFKNLKPSAKLLIIALLLHLPVYTFFGYGVGHQRIKIPFQLAIFLLFSIMNSRVKLENKIAN